MLFSDITSSRHELGKEQRVESVLGWFSLGMVVNGYLREVAFLVRFSSLWVVELNMEQRFFAEEKGLVGSLGRNFYVGFSCLQPC